LQADAVETVGYVDLVKVHGSVRRIRVPDTVQESLQGASELHGLFWCQARRRGIHPGERKVDDQAGSSAHLWY
jgi:hypothetical protein